MNTYINQMKAYLGKCQAEGEVADMGGMLEVSYSHYLERPYIPPQEQRSLCAKLNNCLSQLCFQDSDRIWVLVDRLCSEHERAGFLDGTRIGAAIVLELIADNNP